VKATTARVYPRVTVDGAGVVSHAGTALLRELADRTGLRAEFSVAMDGTRSRAGGHDPGQVLVDLAVMLADGGEAIRDIAALADQPGLHGPVASAATAWRVLDAVDTGRLAGLRLARAAVRDRAWLARGEVTGRELPAARAAGKDLDYVVIDLDATLIEVHSEKEQAAGNFKGGYGYHPLLAFLDNTNEALAGILRPGNAGSNTATDHIAVLDAALAQLPDAYRAKRILVRTDGAGFSHTFLDHLVEQGLEYSVGFAVTDDVRATIARVPRWAWTPAVDAAGGWRDGAEVVDITGMLDRAGWPQAMRVIVRRERPHPGAQLDAFEERDGYRYQAMATNTGIGQLAFLEARHRAHARVEDRIRQLQDAGGGRLPSRLFALNAVWLELALTAADLLAFTQTILLSDQPDLARAEWKTIRYRLLHTAARITRGARQTWLRLAEGWPWTLALARAFAALRRIPLPA
jgi:Transposase DDE domain group 1